MPTTPPPRVSTRWWGVFDHPCPTVMSKHEMEGFCDQQKPSVLCFDALVGFSTPTHPLQANTKNASMWTRFWCWPALHLLKTKITPMGACFWFLPASLPIKPTPKTCPHRHVFGVSLLSTSRKSEARPWGHVSGFRRLLSPSPALHLSKTKSMPMGACFWFLPASLAFTSMPTPKTHPWGRVFGVGWLSSARKPETHPHGCVSGIFWLFPTPRTLPPPQSDRFRLELVGHSSHHRAEHLKHTCGCVFCVQRIFCLFSPVLVTTFLGIFFLSIYVV